MRKSIGLPMKRASAALRFLGAVLRSCFDVFALQHTKEGRHTADEECADDEEENHRMGVGLMSGSIISL